MGTTVFYADVCPAFFFCFRFIIFFFSCPRFCFSMVSWIFCLNFFFWLRIFSSSAFLLASRSGSWNGRLIKNWQYDPFADSKSKALNYIICNVSLHGTPEEQCWPVLQKLRMIIRLNDLFKRVRFILLNYIHRSGSNRNGSHGNRANKEGGINNLVENRKSPQ